jgi:hypothetical protein
MTAQTRDTYEGSITRYLDGSERTSFWTISGIPSPLR